MKDDKLNRIFDATLNLTGKVGIAGLKMSTIAKEAQIASGTLYIYFKSKEDLLNALYKKLQKESAPSIINQISHLPIDVQLYKMWKLALEKLISSNLRIIFLEQFVISPYISEANKDLDAAFRDYLKNLLNKGKKEDLIKTANNNILISLIIGFLRNFSSYVVYNNDSQLTEKLIDESFALCWEAIKK